MSVADTAMSAAQARRRRPPAPVPDEREFGRLELLLRLRRNPLTIWRRRHFREPIVAGEGLFGYGVVVSDPEVVRHVLVENAANYRKDDLQRTVLAPGLGEGLLTAEGAAWKRARRTLAPLFTPRSVTALAQRMVGPAERTAERMARRRSGRIVDISADMTRVTYDILAETMFSNAIAGGADAFGKALTRYSRRRDGSTRSTCSARRPGCRASGAGWRGLRSPSSRRRSRRSSPSDRHCTPAGLAGHRSRTCSTPCSLPATPRPEPG